MPITYRVHLATIPFAIAMRPIARACLHDLDHACEFMTIFLSSSLSNLRLKLSANELLELEMISLWNCSGARGPINNSTTHPGGILYLGTLYCYQNCTCISWMLVLANRTRGIGELQCGRGNTMLSNPSGSSFPHEEPYCLAAFLSINFILLLAFFNG